MLETMLGFTLSEVQASQFRVPPIGRPMFGPLACADGYLMVAVASEKTFQSMCEAAGHPEWITDPRFAAYVDRRSHWGDFMALAEAWSGTLTVAQCQAIFDAHGVPCSPYRTVAQALADPQIAHRDALAEVHDAGGSFRIMNPPFRFSQADTRAGARSPALGEHTEAVLREAGLPEAAIAALRPNGKAGA
jgi:crotonobetainyl-CoA:carnitine CoA-transferase CaiB-like acyl-CoA transferase